MSGFIAPRNPTIGLIFDAIETHRRYKKFKVKNHGFPKAICGQVVTQVRDGDWLTIEVKVEPVKIYEGFGRNELFIFDREVLRYQYGYRNLVGKKVSLTSNSIKWGHRGRTYEVTMQERRDRVYFKTSISKIGR